MLSSGKLLGSPTEALSPGPHWKGPTPTHPLGSAYQAAIPTVLKLCSQVIQVNDTKGMLALIVRLTVIFMLTAAYLGLAVLGWGGFSAFFSRPPLIALAIGSFALAGVASFSSGSLSSGEREDRGNRWVIVAFGLVGLLDGYLPAYTDRNGLWTIDGDAIRWLGVMLFLGGGALRLWPVFVLGRRFSGLVAIQAGHTLVTSGVYGVIRHPSYLGMLVMTLGWGLAFRSWVGVLLTLLIVPPLVARIPAEESLLGTQFGAEYDAYRARTSRLIPGLY
jgi:protein-S-isoprenylcysteine O-methyltransferase Ste14